MTIAVWLAGVAVLLILAVLSENEFWGWSTAVIVVAFVGLAMGGAFNLYHFALSHPMDMLRYAGLYISAGAFWMVFKWWRFCVGVRKDYNAIFRTGDTYLPKRPVPSEHKERIITWGYLWPFSMIGTIVNDLLRDLWEHLYEWAEKLMEAISNHVWKGIEDGPKTRV